MLPTTLSSSRLLASIIFSSSITIGSSYSIQFSPRSKLYWFLYPSEYDISIVLLLVQFVSFIFISGIFLFTSILSFKFISLISKFSLPPVITNLYDPSGMLITVKLLTNVVDNNSVLFLSYTFIFASFDASFSK